MAGEIYIRRVLGVEGTAATSEVFTETLERDITRGIVPGSVKVYASPTATRWDVGYGTLIAVDDGAGNLVPEAGKVLAASTVDYATGVIYVEEDATTGHFGPSTWCVVDYKSVMLAATDWERTYLGDNRRLHVPSRVLHSSLSDPLTKHGLYCLQMKPLGIDHEWFQTGSIYVIKNWDSADDSSIAILFRRSKFGRYVDGPAVSLVSRFSGLANACYYATFRYNYPAPRYMIGCGAPSDPYATWSIPPAGSFKDDDTTEQNAWHALRLDVQTQGANVRTEIFHTQACDGAALPSELNWHSKFALLHVPGEATPTLVSGTTNGISQTWQTTVPVLSGKHGFQFGASGYPSSGESTFDRGYVSSFQARKL